MLTGPVCPVPGKFARFALMSLVQNHEKAVRPLNCFIRLSKGRYSRNEFEVSSISVLKTFLYIILFRCI